MLIQYPIDSLNILSEKFINNPNELISIIDDKSKEWKCNKRDLLLSVMDAYNYLEEKKLAPHGCARTFGLTAKILD